MNLKDKIQEDLKEAMVEKNEEKLSTIRMLKSALQYYEIQKGGANYNANDDEVIEVIGREAKKRKESIDLYEKGGRQELADKEKRELMVLQAYLPKQLSDEEIKNLVEEAISSSGASTMQDMGKVMSILSPQIKGKADGGMVSGLVREKLN